MRYLKILAQKWKNIFFISTISNKNYPKMEFLIKIHNEHN